MFIEKTQFSALHCLLLFNFLETSVKMKFNQSPSKTDGMIMGLKATPTNSCRECLEFSVVTWPGPRGQCSGQTAGPQITSALTTSGKAKDYTGLLQMEGLRGSQVCEVLVPGVGDRSQ